MLSERMKADGFSGSTCDKEFYSLSKVCCCLLFAYSQHSFLFKLDYLAGKVIVGHLGAAFTSGVCPGYPCRGEVWEAGPMMNPLVSQQGRLRGA